MNSNRPARACALVITAALAVTAATAASVGADASPPGTPERVGPPSSLAVLGDSISTATGTGVLGAETPANSWSTGTNASVNSTYRRLLGINPAITGNNVTMAQNGRRMGDMAGQAANMPATTEYVQVQLGGNDLCRPTVAEMTPVDTYRQQFVAGLEAIAARAPEALISVSSVPDIYNLWYIRYAPASFNGQQSDQASQARSYVSLSIIPCLSLLANPASVSEADLARRLEVRQRNIEFNQVLAEECAKVLRCNFDDGAVFAFSSNRAGDPIDGPYLPRAEWTFTDLDISRNTISFCPLTGAFVAGCGDHFHPSISGQTKLAAIAWDASYDWSDTTPPAIAASVTPAPNEAGWNAGPVTVSAGALDDVGVRGIEYRVYATDGTVGAWTAVLDASASVDVVDEGVSHVEFRALDVNGNLSASEIVTVRIDVTDPTISLVTPADGSAVVLGSEVTADYACDDVLSGIASCAGPVASGEPIDTASVGLKDFAVDAVDAAGNTSSVTHRYSVEYAFSGFSGPFASGQHTARGNATVPLIFSLADVDGVGQSDAVVEVVLVGSDGVERPAPQTGGESNLARWDADAGQFVFNLATGGLASGDWQIVVRPDDGTEYSATLTRR